MKISGDMHGAAKVKVYDAMGRNIPGIKELDTETGQAVLYVRSRTDTAERTFQVAVGKRDGKNDLIEAMATLTGCTVEGLNHVDPTMPARVTL